MRTAALLSLLVFLCVSFASTIASPGWFTPDTPEEKMVKAKKERDECLARAAKDARSDLGFRQLGSQCYIEFNAKRDEIYKPVFDEIFFGKKE